MNKKIEKTQYENLIHLSRETSAFFNKFFNFTLGTQNLWDLFQKSRDFRQLLKEFAKNENEILIALKIKKLLKKPIEGTQRNYLIIFGDIISQEITHKKPISIYFSSFTEFLQNNLRTNNSYLIKSLSPKFKNLGITDNSNKIIKELVFKANKKTQSIFIYKYFL